MSFYSHYYFSTKGSRRHAFRSWLIDKVFFFLKARPKFFMPEKVLIICNGHIGDTIMATAIFREIKEIYPKVKIHALISNISKQILETNPYIDKIIPMNVFWQKEHRDWKSFKEYLGLINQLKKEKYDIGIDIPSNIPNIITLYLSGIKKRSAYYNLDGGKPFLTNPALYDADVHASIMALNLVNQGLNMNTTNNLPEIHISNEDKAYANLFFNIHTLNKYICIVPGSCAKLQTWDKEKYKAIIEWMLKEHSDYHIILCGGKEDEELIDYLSQCYNKCIKLINHNLRQLGIIFNNAACVLLQDGGPMHLAYTCMEEANRKLFILWGPNPLTHVAPLRGNLIHHPLPCYPCRRQESECKMPEGKRCMDLISLEEVKKEMEKVL